MHCGGALHACPVPTYTVHGLPGVAPVMGYSLFFSTSLACVGQVRRESRTTSCGHATTKRQVQCMANSRTQTHWPVHPQTTRLLRSMRVTFRRFFSRQASRPQSAMQSGRILFWAWLLTPYPSSARGCCTYIQVQPYERDALKPLDIKHPHHATL